MKKSITLFFIYIIICFSSFAQESYQIFNSAGFKVKCNCTLKAHSSFIQKAKQQGVNNIFAAYYCAENENDFDIGVIIDIIVYDQSVLFTNIQPSDYARIEKENLKQYEENLSNSGYKYNYCNYKGSSAIEYSFDQLGLPTKAIVFFLNKRFYLLQVGTRTNLDYKYNGLKNNFIIL